MSRFYVSDFVLSMCKMKVDFVYWQFLTIIAFCALFHLKLVHISHWMTQPLLRVHYVSDITVTLNEADCKCMLYNNLINICITTILEYTNNVALVFMISQIPWYILWFLLYCMTSSFCQPFCTVNKINVIKHYRHSSWTNSHLSDWKPWCVPFHAI